MEVDYARFERKRSRSTPPPERTPKRPSLNWSSSFTELRQQPAGYPEPPHTAIPLAQAENAQDEAYQRDQLVIDPADLEASSSSSSSSSSIVMLAAQQQTHQTAQHGVRKRGPAYLQQRQLGFHQQIHTRPGMPVRHSTAEFIKQTERLGLASPNDEILQFFPPETNASSQPTMMDRLSSQASHSGSVRSSSLASRHVERVHSSAVSHSAPASPVLPPASAQETAMQNHNWLANGMTTSRPNTFAGQQERPDDMQDATMSVDVAPSSQPERRVSPRKHNFTMGYRADCLKCQQGVEGHYAHVY
ncbi:uncharacterized protein L969DRAFT_97363 [Mixia osmundae IAM 14324]|uniref:Uncharacterized protein n=1 Tax=Mixia osmundae (strain CBS 9802 / IAM 14324 / JCM 22182 / KY 12970) TaxID=764103 RepID=G7DV21_MIXOS|nr:uncharacterized protein L969DRAFT_97363 [Mixia osmundae IAM 14324]KEI36352.1 hypothetical protein L969DRAFT_97363 [Mixia osmundae IAM 14324]GAA94431.1 hypothetical protein E5Q_01083 [Mixia osmundae IAM 14324]